MAAAGKTRPTKPPVADDGWMTLNQGVIALGQGRATVLERIVAGEIRSDRKANHTFVARADIERLLADRTASKPARRRKAAR